MLTLYDYLPSQNAWKVRQILHHLSIPHKTEIVSIFEAEGQSAAYREINPWGAVPAVRFADGRVLSESNAILWYFSGSTLYRPADPFQEAKVMQWLCFEADYIQPTIGSLQYWMLTGKVESRPQELVAGKRAGAERALKILDEQLSLRTFMAGDDYSIADIAIFAYAHRADAAGVATGHLVAFRAWIDRIRTRPGFLGQMHPYSIDPSSAGELP